MGLLTQGEVVDHIKPIRTHPELAFDPANLQTLCKRCHDSVKHREEMTGHRVGVDSDGNPLDGW